MIQTIEELAKTLQSTVLKDSNLDSIEIPESKRLACHRSTALNNVRLLAFAAILFPDNTIYLSVISAWEMTIKDVNKSLLLSSLSVILPTRRIQS